jgi:hypothetical protein
MSNLSHKPGYRYADAGGTVHDERAAAFDSYVEGLTSAWKPAWRKEQDLRDSQRTAADPPKPADFVEAYSGEWQRHLATAELVRDSNKPAPGTRWNEDGPGLEVNAFSQTRAVPDRPDGAYAPVGVGANEGDVVTVNGRPARLVKRGNFLYPEFIETGPSRSSETINPNSDHAMVGDRSLQDAAWHEMCAAQREMWKTPA